MRSELESIFLNGTVGAGKTTTAEILHDQLTDEGVSSAMIDLDQIRRCWPAPATDPFNHELELRNLHSLAENYRQVGVQRIILAGVLEDPAEEERYRIAVGGGKLTVIRLEPPLETVHERLRNRHESDSEELSWHLERSVELQNILTHARLDAHVVAIGRKNPQEVARAVRALAGW